MSAEPGMVWVHADVDLAGGDRYVTADIRLPTPHRVEVDLIERRYEGGGHCAIVPLRVHVPAWPLAAGAYRVVVTAYELRAEAVVIVPPDSTHAASQVTPTIAIESREEWIDLS